MILGQMRARADYAGVPAWGKPLVDEAITTTLRLPSGSDAVLPCRAAVVACNPRLRRGPDPPSPRADGLVLAQAEPWPASAAGLGAGAAAQGVRRSLSWQPGRGWARRLPSGMPPRPCTCWRPARLTSAPRCGQRRKHAFVVVLDGTLIPIDRLAADRPFYSGKHRRHGMNLQVLAVPAGRFSGYPARCPAAWRYGRVARAGGGR